MELIATFVLNILSVTFASLVFLLIGKQIQHYLPLEKLQSIYFQIATQFFLGCALFVFVWLTSNLLIQSVFQSLVITTVLALLLIIYRTPRISISRHNLVILIVVILLVQAIGFSRAFDPMPAYVSEQPEVVNPLLGFGTVVHSFRAGNITQFIIESDRFPILGQHSFQGVVASISSVIPLHSIQLSLVLWLNTFVAFSIFLVYGFLTHFINRWSALLGTLVVIAGNTVLSPFYSSITDTERPILLASNYEALFGIATLFLAVLILFYTSPRIRLHALVYLTFFVLGFVWNVSSGQMIAVLLLLIAATALYHRFRQIQVFLLMKLGVALSLGWIIGILLLGGMFSSGNSLDIQKVPGTLSVTQDNQKPIELRFPRTVEGGQHTTLRLRQLYSQIASTAQLESMVSETPQATADRSRETGDSSAIALIKSHPITFGIANIIRSFQVVFFPLLGIFLAWYVLGRKILPEQHMQLYRYLTYITMISFLLGWFVSTFFTAYGYYWELSRFFYFGAFLSMLLLGLSGAILYPSFSTRKKILTACVLIFILLGPSIEMVLRSVGDGILTPKVATDVIDIIPEEMQQPLTFPERIEFLLKDSNVMFGEDYINL
jgi:hypothetical protein